MAQQANEANWQDEGWELASDGFPNKRPDFAKQATRWLPDTDFYVKAFAMDRGFLMSLLYPYWVMCRDVLKTFQRYKHIGKLRDDFLQPFYGAGNVIKALALAFMGAVVVIIMPLFIIPLLPIITAVMVTKAVYDFTNQAVSAFIIGVVSAFAAFTLMAVIMPIMALVVSAVVTVAATGWALRGISQILTTPLTLALRIPLRSALTVIWGPPKIETSRRIQKAIRVATHIDPQATPELRNEIIQSSVAAIHKKFQARQALAQPTAVDVEEEREFSYSAKSGNESAVANYFNLFQPDEGDLTAAYHHVSLLSTTPN